MDLRTAVLTVVLLGIGYAAGALTTSAGETAPEGEPRGTDTSKVWRTSEPGLDGRAAPPAAPSSDNIGAALARIEKLLMANPMAAGTSDEKIVERITEVWRPVLLEAIESHQTQRARTRLITLFERRVKSAKEAVKRDIAMERPVGNVAMYEQEERELRERLEAIRKARTAPELIEALTANPETAGDYNRSNAIMIVYGDKHPD